MLFGRAREKTEKKHDLVHVLEIVKRWHRNAQSPSEVIYARSPPITVNTIRVIHRLEKMVKIVMASNITVKTNLVMTIWSLVTTINIKLVTLQLEKDGEESYDHDLSVKENGEEIHG